MYVGRVFLAVFLNYRRLYFGLTGNPACRHTAGPHHQPYFDHFFIHCKRYITDSTSSCPLPVSRYSTRGGISLYAFLSKMPPFSSSLRRLASVLLLMPLRAFRNCLYLTGSAVQHSGIRISSVPLFVIILRSRAVSAMSDEGSWPAKLQS